MMGAYRGRLTDCSASVRAASSSHCRLLWGHAGEGKGAISSTPESALSTSSDEAVDEAL